MLKKKMVLNSRKDNFCLNLHRRQFDAFKEVKESDPLPKMTFQIFTMVLMCL